MGAQQTYWRRVFLPKATFKALIAEAKLCGLDWMDFKASLGETGSPHSKWLVNSDKILANAMANALLEETVLITKTTMVQETLESYTGRVNQKMWVSIELTPVVMNATARKARIVGMKADDFRYALIQNALIALAKEV